MSKTHSELRTPSEYVDTLYILPPDAKFLPVGKLSARLRAKIGPTEDGQSVITRPGFRITTRLVPGPLADLIREFNAPTRLTDAVFRFSHAYGQDPSATLDLAFDALATLVDSRVLVPQESPDATAPVPTLAAGQEFAGLEIEALVRSLDDSEVYRARATDGQLSALKIARAENSRMAAMLEHEAAVLERLGGLVSPDLLGQGTQSGRSFLAMEWCDGRSIAIAAQRARAGRDRRTLYGIVRRMFEAYARIHQSGVLHGDVHPGNCLVRDDGRVTILDFGTARLIDGEPAVHDPTRTGIPQFHDPQMAAALLAQQVPPGATQASEQYSIAVLAYLLLSGTLPTEAPAVHDQLYRSIMERPPLPFAARGVASWPEVEAVVRRGLAKRPGDRFPDTDGLAEAFAEAALPSPRPLRPAAALAPFEATVHSVRNLEVSSGTPCERAWFALRAALALEDGELLAAAEVLLQAAEPGWARHAVGAHVARARSDRKKESQTVTGFLDAMNTDSAGPQATAAAILAAAGILAGASLRPEDSDALAKWGMEGIDGMTAPPQGTDAAVTERTLIRCTLALVSTGTVSVPTDLGARLDALDGSSEDDVWLWTLAHQVFADERFLDLALGAPLPAHPLWRGFALIRLHQRTGDPRWVTEAEGIVGQGRAAGLSDLETALLVDELRAPENLVLPPGIFARPRRPHA